MTQHGKSYSGAEYQRRLAVFLETVKTIEAHKAEFGVGVVWSLFAILPKAVGARSQAASWMGLNEFSAMTKEEFAKDRLL